MAASEREMVEHWTRHRAEYVESLRQAGTADASGGFAVSEVLSRSGRAHVERGPQTIVVFLVKTWGIDESWGIVHLSPESPVPESDPVLEKWSSAKRLEPGWFLVRGT